MDAFWTLPPFSRTIAAGALIVSGLGYSGLLPLYPLLFHPSKLFKLPPQIWRIITAFLITGPNMRILLDPVFFYRSGSFLEENATRYPHPGDFVVYLLFNCLFITLTAGWYLGYPVLLSPLMVALSTTQAQENPNAMVSMFIITFQAKYVPLSMIFMSLVTNGMFAAQVDLCGFLAAHMYDFLTRIWPTFGGGRNWLKTPNIVYRNVPPRPRTHVSSSGGTAIPPPSQRQAYGEGGNSAGWSSGVSNVWGNRGPGRRLG